MAWEEKDNQLYRSFKFKDFGEAFSFMTHIAIIAEKLDHHPTWTNTWNKVEIWLCTHSEGNKVTDKDRKLAAEIDKITGEVSPKSHPKSLKGLPMLSQAPVKQRTPRYGGVFLNSII